MPTSPAVSSRTHGSPSAPGSPAASEAASEATGFRAASPNRRGGDAGCNHPRLLRRRSAGDMDDDSRSNQILDVEFENIHLGNQLDDLEKKLETANNTLKFLQKETRSADEIEPLKTHISNLEEKLGSLGRIEAELEKAKSENERRHQTNVKTRSFHAKEHEDIKKKLSGYKSDNRNLRKENESLQIEVDSLNKKVEILNSDLASCKSDLIDSQNDLRKMRENAENPGPSNRRPRSDKKNKSSQDESCHTCHGLSKSVAEHKEEIEILQESLQRANGFIRNKLGENLKEICVLKKKLKEKNEQYEFFHGENRVMFTTIFKTYEIIKQYRKNHETFLSTLNTTAEKPVDEDYQWQCDDLVKFLMSECRVAMAAADKAIEDDPYLKAIQDNSDEGRNPQDRPSSPDRSHGGSRAG